MSDGKCDENPMVDDLKKLWGIMAFFIVPVADLVTMPAHAIGDVIGHVGARRQNTTVREKAHRNLSSRLRQFPNRNYCATATLAS